MNSISKSPNTKPMWLRGAVIAGAASVLLLLSGCVYEEGYAYGPYSGPYYGDYGPYYGSDFVVGGIHHGGHYGGHHIYGHSYSHGGGSFQMCIRDSGSGSHQRARNGHPIGLTLQFPPILRRDCFAD